MAGYWIFKNSKFRLTATLPDHIYKPRCQTKHHTAAILYHNNKLTSEMCLFGVPTSVGPLHLVVSFIFYQALLHAAKPYWCINFPIKLTLSSASRCHNINFKALALGIGQVQIQYFECNIRVKSMLKWIDIYVAWWMAVNLSFSLILTDKIKHLPCPFWRCF